VGAKARVTIESRANHRALVYNKPQGENSYLDGAGDYHPWKKDH